jgi:anti-sigma factor RsiW
MQEQFNRDDERFLDLVDGSLPPAEALALEQALREDDDLERSLRGYRDIVGRVRDLPDEPAPPELLELVQQRIRRKTRGRFYGTTIGSSFPYQAAVSVILLGIMAAIYLLGHPTEEKPRLVDPSKLVTLPAGVADAIGLAGGTLNGVTERCGGNQEATLPASEVDRVASRLARTVTITRAPGASTGPTVRVCFTVVK